MRHLRATSVLQPSMEKQETQKRPRRACSFRIILRCGIMLVCLILASYVLGVIFKLSGDHGNTFHDFVNQPNSTKVVSEYSSSLPKPPGLNFMEGKSVVVVSHELSLSGGPLLLMELGHILRRSGAFVYWVTGNKKENTSDPVVVFLEEKLLNHGLQVIPARGTRTVSALTTADLVILNTAVAGKWVSSAFKADIKKLLAKTLWWIHEMRGHYFAPEYVKFLPEVAGVITDSHATADYWRTRTRDRLRMTLPKMHVVHLGNSQQLMLDAEDAVGRASMRQRVRQIVGIFENDIVFAMINSVSRGKGQDLFLRAFVEGVNLVKKTNMVQQTVFSVHALVVGGDHAAPPYQSMLHKFVEENGLQSTVHFVKKTMDVVPYLAAADVLVQNSQGRGECFGRITIEAMAFQLPVLGTAAGGTLEIVMNGTTGRLHPVGKDGVHILAKNMRDLILDKSLRIRMGSRGYERVKQQFLESHMCERLGRVFRTVLPRTA